MKLTLVLPPLTQLNTPYPSTAYLARFLGDKGVSVKQRDLGIELVLRLFTAECLVELFAELEEREELVEPAWRALSLQRQHCRVVEPVIAFLQGRDSGLAGRILETPFLPMGPRLSNADISAFGTMGTDDAARHLATLYLADLADLFTVVDPGFGLARYQHNLAVSARSFDPMLDRLSRTTLVDRHLDALTDTIEGNVVGLSVPFPGNLYGALRIGRRLKERGSTIFLGGGYANTELRDTDDQRIWEFIDAISYDDGEGPLLAMLEHLAGKTDRRHRTRTATGLIECEVPRPPATFAADYGDLDLGLYLRLIDTLNPAHRLWADGRWNKITLAHGCYWRRCTFCDVQLDYIRHFENASVVSLVDDMERLIAQTGSRGFHFVDEAAPPKTLKALALELLKRNLGVTLWGNIRFESSFSPDLCRLLAAAGVVAVTGGLEVANERLLKAIDKGVTVEQVARAAAAFRSAGIGVHAYLMYGFPTQTDQETIDSMELVRQLFEADLLQSAFWHRFVLTRHAPIFEDPEAFGIGLSDVTGFANNDVPHSDPSGGDHDQFDAVLPFALDAWMQGRGLERSVHAWFGVEMPTTTEAADRIVRALDEPAPEGSRLLWLGGEPLQMDGGLVIHHPNGELLVQGSPDQMDWVMELVELGDPAAEPLDFADAREGFPGDWSAFASSWQALRDSVIVLV